MKKTKIQGTDYTYETDVNKITFEFFAEKFPKLLKLQKDTIDLTFYDEAEMVAIILGCDYDVAMDAPAEIIQDLSFWKDFELIKQGIPEQIEIEGKKVNVPKTLANCNLSVGQLEFFRQLTLNIDNTLAYPELAEHAQLIATEEIDSMTPEQIQKYSIYVLDRNAEYIKASDKLAACILQSELYGKFRPAKNEELTAKLQKMPFAKIVPIAFFFIQKCNSYYRSSQKN